MIKQTLQGRLALGVALSAMALAPVAQAQNTTASGTMSGGTGGAAMSGSMSTSMSSQPTMVTGRVNNYWTDPSGYVTAVDVQTANGPAVVRFAPGMANRVSQMYPVGSNANLWVQGSTMGGQTNWDLVGIGDKMPASGFWPVMQHNGLDLLAGTPYIMAGAQRTAIMGQLRRVVVDRMGQVLGLVVETNRVYSGTPKMETLFGSESGGPGLGDVSWEAQEGGAPMWTLVRVTPEFRHTPHQGGMARKTPLMVGDDVMAVGYMEAPAYGTMSPYGQRLIASGITVNGRGVGQMGFPTYKPNQPTLLNFNLNIPLITGGSSAQLPVVTAGYETYGSGDMTGSTMGAGNSNMGGSMGGGASSSPNATGGSR